MCSLAAECAFGTVLRRDKNPVADAWQHQKKLNRRLCAGRAGVKRGNRGYGKVCGAAEGRFAMVGIEVDGTVVGLGNCGAAIF